MQASERSIFSSASEQTRRTAPRDAAGPGDEGGEVADDDDATETAQPAPASETFESSFDLLRRGIIDPVHRNKLRWDLYVGILTLAAVIIVPLRLGFIDYMREDGYQEYRDVFGNPTDVNPFWINLDYYIDSMFGLDILCNFRTAYEDQSGYLVTDWKLIGKRCVCVCVPPPRPGLDLDALDRNKQVLGVLVSHRLHFHRPLARVQGGQSCPNIAFAQGAFARWRARESRGLSVSRAPRSLPGC